MTIAIPAWAMRRAQAEDYDVVRDTHRRGTLQIKWPNRKGLRDWSKLQGWSTPWYGFEAAFLTMLFDSQMNFVQAISESGIELQPAAPDCAFASPPASALSATSIRLV